MATINGDTGDNTLDGTNSDDVINGDAGNDTLNGNDGNDDLDGDEGNDLLNGGLGNDDLRGGIGNDTLNGDAGNDTLDGGSGDDTLNGGAGRDTLTWSFGNDTLNGGDDNDTFYLNGVSSGVGSIFANGDAGDDVFDLFLPAGTSGISSGTIDGGTGTDILTISNGADFTRDVISFINIEVIDFAGVAVTFDAGHFDSVSEIRNIASINHSDIGGVTDFTGKISSDDSGSFSGGSGDDTFTVGAGVNASWSLIGGDGADTLTGGDGDDTLLGRNGNDTLNGGDGNDTLSDSQGNNVMNGGDGNDTLSSTGAGNLSANGGAGDDLIVGNNIDASMDWIIEGGSGTDTFEARGNSNDLSFITISGFEIFDGANGIHTVESDFFDNFSQMERLREINLTDNGGTMDLTGKLLTDDSGVFNAGTAGNTIIIGSGSIGTWTLNGSSQSDNLTGGDGNDTLGGNGGNDTLTGGLGDDRLSGDAGDDVLTGGSGDDSLNSGSGTDTLSGGLGNDTLTGSGGTNTLNGGEGDDTLRFGTLEVSSVGIGGAGDDLFEFSSFIEAGDIASLDGGAGTDTLDLGLEADLTGTTITNFEILDISERTLTIDASNLLQFSSILNVGTIEMATGGSVDLTGRVALDDTGTVLGSSDDDTITVDANATANWSLGGNGGNDTLTGGLGDDRLSGDAGDDVLTGGSGDDSLNSGSGTDTLSGGLGNDTLTGSGGTNTLNGGEGDDTLRFGTLEVSSVGIGGAGDDLFEFRFSIDAGDIASLDGGAGTDTLDLGLEADLTGTTITSIEILNAKSRTLTVDAGVLMGFTTLQNLERVDLASGGVTDLTGLLAVDDGGTFFGSGESDTIIIGAEVTADWGLFGGDGDDTLTGGSGNDSLSGGNGTDVLNGGDGDDTLSGRGTDTRNGGNGNDTLEFTSVDVMSIGNGGAGDDLFDFRSAISTGNIASLDGGIGTDMIEMILDANLAGTTITNVEILNANSRTLTVDAGVLAGFTTLLNLERVDHSSGGTTDLTGLLEVNDGGTFFGSLEDDIITIGAEVIADWGIFGSDGNNILTGGSGNDTLTSGNGVDTLNGGAGNDSLSGGAGANTLTGGAGADEFVLSLSSGGSTLADANVITDFTIGSDQVSLQNFSSPLTLRLEQLGTDAVIRVESSGTFLAVLQNIDVKDLSLADFKDESSLTLNVVNDVPVVAGDLAASVSQGASTTLTTSDLTAIDADDFADALNFTIDSTLFGSVQVSGANATSFTQAELEAGLVSFLQDGTFARDANFTFSLTDDGGASAGSATLIFSVDITPTIPGSNSDDILVGTAGNDLIAGEDGNDNIDGGLGNDSILGDAGNDMIDGAGGADFIEGGVGNDLILGGDQNDNLFGGDGNDQVLGQRGADFLYGGAGNDLVLGGNRNDRLFGEDGDDRVFGGNDQDTVSGGAGRDIVRGGDGDDLISGDAGNDVMFGGTGRDTVNGGEGDDLLWGRGGFDILNGGSGNDTLEGGLQADQFIFEDGFGNDTITDFASLNNAERIHLTEVTEITDFQDLIDNHLNQVGTDVVIDDGLGNTITLLNVQLSDLDAMDFVF